MVLILDLLDLNQVLMDLTKDHLEVNNRWEHHTVSLMEGQTLTWVELAIKVTVDLLVQEFIALGMLILRAV